MRPGDREEAGRLERQLTEYETTVGRLPGIEQVDRRTVLIEQLLESQRRNRYVQVLLSRELGPQSANPDSPIFDPLKAAIICARRGDNEEAFWLVFLFVHFGKHKRGGYTYARQVYGRLGQGSYWDWPSISAGVDEFRTWLDAHKDRLRRKGQRGGFGNHRKYESLDGWTESGTGAVVASYVDWVSRSGSHVQKIHWAIAQASGDQAVAFDVLYRSLSSVQRFGRTARFDYLSMIDRIELAQIRPGKAYIAEATGPRRGAALLFGITDRPVDSRLIEDRLRRLENYLETGYDTLEDALCNWQKSPAIFRPFRG
jgi:hypothetical protein